MLKCENTGFHFHGWTFWDPESFAIGTSTIVNRNSVQYPLTRVSGINAILMWIWFIHRIADTVTLSRTVYGKSLQTTSGPRACNLQWGDPPRIFPGCRTGY